MFYFAIMCLLSSHCTDLFSVPFLLLNIYHVNLGLTHGLLYQFSNFNTLLREKKRETQTKKNIVIIVRLTLFIHFFRCLFSFFEYFSDCSPYTDRNVSVSVCMLAGWMLGRHHILNRIECCILSRCEHRKQRSYMKIRMRTICVLCGA